MSSKGTPLADISSKRNVGPAPPSSSPAPGKTPGPTAIIAHPTVPAPASQPPPKQKAVWTKEGTLGVIVANGKVIESLADSSSLKTKHHDMAFEHFKKETKDFAVNSINRQQFKDCWSNLKKESKIFEKLRNTGSTLGEPQRAR